MQDSLQQYTQEIAELRTRATSTDLVFKSTPMQRLWTLMQNTANTRANILITGETGVGKSAVAKAIHKMSNRAGGPLHRGQLRRPPREPHRVGAVRL